MNSIPIIENHFSVPMPTTEAKQNKTVESLLMEAMERVPTEAELKRFIETGQKIPWPIKPDKWEPKQIAWQVAKGALTIGLNHPGTLRTVASLFSLSWNMRS